MKVEKGKAYIVLNPFGTMLIVRVSTVGLFSDAVDSWNAKRWRFHFKRTLKIILNGHVKFGLMYFRGFEARPDIFPGKLRKCGSGWTRARAFRRLQRRIKKS